MSSDDFVSGSQLASVTAEQKLTEQIFPYSFIEIIDADHDAINRLAGKIRKVLASSTVNSRLLQLKSLLLEVTWRLIRHDFSEDIVMRPAFAATLDDYGAEMVERDRAEHARGRDLLASILEEIDLAMKGDMEGRSDDRIAKVGRMVTETFDELAEHMKIESGEVLPHFESVISTDVSAKLAKEYANTLLMTPDLVRLGGQNEGQSSEAVFSGGVEEYIHATPVELKQHYLSILEDTTTKAGRVWFDRMTAKELGKIRIDKKPTKSTVVKPEVDERPGESTKPKVPSNALGLPVRWDHLKKGKL